MLPYVLYAAGLAAISLFSAGCASQSPLTPPRSKPGPKPPHPKLPKTAPPPPGPAFPKGALDYTEDGENGYDVIRQSLLRRFHSTEGEAYPVQEFSWTEALTHDSTSKGLLELFIEKPERIDLAQKFVGKLAGFDGKAEDVSLYDYLFSSFYLYTKQWKEPWGEQFFEDQKVFPYASAEHIKIIGRPLLDPATGKAVNSQSRDLLQSLALFLNSQDPSDPRVKLSPLVDFYLKGDEPEIFSRYLKIPYKTFLKATDQEKAKLFKSAIESEWPTKDTLEDLAPYLGRAELSLLVKECFQKDTMASFTLFENVSLPANFSLDSRSFPDTGEVDIFPNLAQDAAFMERQAAIDAFLGEPVLIKEKRHYYANAKTTVKKYLWYGETEVFSIESGRPGPTTLVFSPHFHEPNPRKYFHWLKELPLKSGRVIFLPEANRALSRTSRDTNPMNRIFNKALGSQRMDYLIVRRVEYLMGLLDGVIGDHDAWAGPFYISDELVEANGERSSALGPQASPWVPKQVRQIEEIDYAAEQPQDESKGPNPQQDTPKTKPETIRSDNQIQWQIADYSRKKLRELTGRDYRFTPEAIRDENSMSLKTTTGYTQFRLRKPAMTFEGSKTKEHGQLHAMAIYTLLLGFGHKIPKQFERRLKDPLPKMEPDLYRGNHVTLTNLPEEETRF